MPGGNFEMFCRPCYSSTARELIRQVIKITSRKLKYEKLNNTTHKLNSHRESICWNLYRFVPLM